MLDAQLRIPVWLDTDPGHDDAMAILLALHTPNINLLGISTVHGNASAECTKINAIRLLEGFAASPNIHVHPGAVRPLMRQPRADPEIHGADGLGGVEGLPCRGNPAILRRILRSATLKAIDGIARAVKDCLESGPKLTLVACGPLTNIALFISVYPELVSGLERICFMGGGVGIGNRGAVAEFNVLCDPEAAQIVLDAPVPTVMIPLNTTHTAILTRPRHARILSGMPTVDTTLPPAATPLRHTISTMLSFFADAYKHTFGFQDGPPLHDALTIAYVSRPDIFSGKRQRVDVECTSGLSLGQTVVDVWGYRDVDDAWGHSGKNCFVTEGVDVDAFFELLFGAIDRCDMTVSGYST